MKMTIQKMTISDIEDVMRIERESYAHTWNAEAFKAIIESKQTRSRVAKLDGDNVGFLIYRPFRHKLFLQGLGILVEHRRNGIGTALFRTIYDDLDRNKKLYNRIIVPILERELPAQLFMKAMGLRAIGIVRAENKTEDDTFLFRYKANHQTRRFNIRKKTRVK